MELQNSNILFDKKANNKINLATAQVSPVIL